jgi:hypothetical protein
MTDNTSNPSEVARATEKAWAHYQSQPTARADAAAFEGASIPLTTIGELPAILCTFRAIPEAVTFFLQRYHVAAEHADSVAAAAGNILRFVSRPGSDAPCAFVSACAEVHVLTYTNAYPNCAQPTLHWEPSRESVVVDLASGPDFVNLLDQVRPEANYFPIDCCPFAVECIRTAAQRRGLPNVHPMCRDVRRLVRADIAADHVDLVRAKNIFAYVPDYASAWGCHLEWLSPGGTFLVCGQGGEPNGDQLLLDRVVQRNLVALVSAGWGFDYRLGDVANPLSATMVALTKPPPPAPKGFERLMQLYGELDKRRQCGQFAPGP